MKRVASLLSEVPPMQGAHATRDGALFQPLSARIPPSKAGTTPGTIIEVAESITAAGDLAFCGGHLDILVNRATVLGPDPFAPPAVLKQEPDDLRAFMSF
jgi:hypothetical protein